MVFSPSDVFGVNRSRAAAKSTNFNPRNLEHLWYPFWTRAVSQIACQVDLERCTVAPQYPLWRIWTRDDTDLGHIEMLSDDDETMGEVHEDDSEDDANDDFIEDDTTLSSINETLSTRTRSRITDFALVHWQERDGVNPQKSDCEDETFIIEQELILALIEIKRCPSRKLTGNKFADVQSALMLRAQEAVFRQALYLFANKRWSKQKSVLTIAAVGDLWTYTVLSRVDISSQVADADESNPDWEPRIQSGQFTAVEWSKPAIWGQAGDTSNVDVVKRWLVEYVDWEHSQ